MAEAAAQQLPGDDWKDIHPAEAQSSLYAHGDDWHDIAPPVSLDEFAGPRITETPLYRAGESIQKFGRETFPVSEEERAAHPYASAIGRTAGAVLPAAAATLGLGPAGALAGAAQMGTSAEADTFDDALAHGADERTASKAAGISGALGMALGAVDLGVVLAPLRRSLPGMTGWAAQKLAQAGQSGVTFAAVGQAQQYLNTEIEKEIYNPDATYSPQFKDMLAAFIVGGGLGAAHPLHRAGETPTPEDRVNDVLARGRAEYRQARAESVLDSGRDAYQRMAGASPRSPEGRPEKLLSSAITPSPLAEAAPVVTPQASDRASLETGAQPGAQPLQRVPIKVAPTGRAMTTEPLRMGRETDVLKAGANLATGEHPARIDQRLPTSKRVFGTDPENLKVDVAAAKESPNAYANNVDLLRNYPNMPTKLARGSDDKVANGFVDHVADNLKWLWDQVPPEVRDRSMQWYDGGNKIVKDWTQEYGLRDSTVAAVIASLSPQKDWFQNVSLARRTLDIMRNKDVTATPEMARQFASRGSLQKYAPIFDRMNGKSLADIDLMDDDSPESRSAMKAMWVRLYDEAHNDPSHRIVTPEGEFGDYVKTDKGANSKIGWGSLGEISKAIESIERNDPSAAQTLLGAKHKVRNFYNNLLSPNSATGDVTIDTHAVAAGLLRPLSGQSPEVLHNFENYVGKGLPSAAGSDVTGVRGTYPFYADAYRRAADVIGVLPRQLQSVTWEAVRSLFPENLKNATIRAEVDGIWDRYRKGRATLDDTRNKILAAAGAEGGIRPPSWFETRPGAVADEGLPHRADETELSRSGLSRQPAEGTGGGGGEQPAATISAEGMNERIAAGAEAQGLRGRGELPGSAVGVAPPSAASGPLGPEEPLRGLPTKVTVPGMGQIDVGPNPKIKRLAADYMQKAGLPYNPPTTYAKVDEVRAKRIADAFDAMPHAPNDPEVKAAYKAMAKETMAQWRAIQKTGLKVEFIRGADPYAASPRLAVKDINENNHMWVFPTSAGFGSGHAFTAKDIADNPLLAPAGVRISGQPATLNDIFRIVHDYFGHAKEGVGFRADGEENAWRSHSAMYSPLARKAMTTETRGQNSWLNFGPHGKANRTAKTENTIFADQKVGVLPDWVVTEGAQPLQRTPTKLAPTGRAMATRPLPIGNENAVLEAGLQRVRAAMPEALAQKDIKQVNPENIVPPHEPFDEALLASLVSSMKSDGWQGRPILIHGYEALTGSHRIAAAQRAGLETIPVVQLAREAARSIDSMGYSLDEARRLGDEELLSFLKDSGDKKAADLMSAEMREHAEREERGVSDVKARIETGEVGRPKRAGGGKERTAP